MAEAAPPQRPVIDVIDLVLERGEVRVLDIARWRVLPGEHWVVLGPNGAGKTALLSALVAYAPPTSGTLRVLGRSYGEDDWRRLRRQVGIVSTALGQLVEPQERACDVVAGGPTAELGVWVPRRGPAQRRAREVLAAIGCGYAAMRCWGVLSLGERQRVLIARALMGRPRVLILDESCAGLDPVARSRLLADLQRLAERSDAPTLIQVTHHVEEILPAVSHALLLGGGRVVAAGPLRRALDAEHLEAAFGAPLRLRRVAGGWRLDPR